MNQTPAHSVANPDLLAILPGVSRVVEVGCSTGALARAYKERHPEAHYVGIDVDPAYVEEARSWCDAVLIGDALALFLDPANEPLLGADCYVFGDSLEHLVDPWRLLHRVHALMPPGGCVCACIPTAQHWSLQARIAIGDLRYEDSGLMDRTHLRWFSRQTMLALFQESGFRVEGIAPRIFPHPEAERVLEQIGTMVQTLGGNPDQAMRDAMPLQYVIRAVRD